MSTATTAMAPPKPSEPTSPMKISAGCALYQRKPRLAPVMEPQKMVSSLVRGLRANCRYWAESVSARVGEHGEGAGGECHQPDGQAIQAIGQIDGVGIEDHHEGDENAKGATPST